MLNVCFFDTNQIGDIGVRKNISENRIRNIEDGVFIKAAKLLLELLREHKEEFNEDIELFIKVSTLYLFSLKTIDIEEAKRKILEIGGEDMKTLADLLIEEGVEKGRLEGLIIDAQDMVLSLIEARLDYIPEGIEEKIRDIKDREYLRILLKKIIKSNDVLELLKYKGLI